MYLQLSYILSLETYLQTVHRIVALGHWVTDQVGKAIRDDGVSEPQYNVMRTLAQAKGRPLTVQELQENMVQANSNITRIIDKLLVKGLVARCECPTNRRKMDITLTANGKSKLKVLDAKVLAFHKPYMKNLGKKELEQLHYLMVKLTGKA